jgi:hypothetical protein
MNTSLRKSIVGAVLMAGVALGGIGIASAEQAGPVSTTIPPGGRACVVTNSPAFYKVRADGSAPSALPGQVQWTVHQSRDGVTFQTIDAVTGSGTNYAAQFASTLYPQYFPGYWKFCARNVSTVWNVKATLTLRTDANDPY